MPPRLFTTIGGQPRNRIAQLDASAGLPDSFDPNANNPVYSIAGQADGKILAGGDFNGANRAPDSQRTNHPESLPRRCDTFSLNWTSPRIAALPSGPTRVAGFLHRVGSYRPFA